MFVALTPTEVALPAEPEPPPALGAPAVHPAPATPTESIADTKRPLRATSPALRRQQDPSAVPAAVAPAPDEEPPEVDPPEDWPSFVDFPDELHDATPAERRAYLTQLREGYEATLREIKANIATMEAAERQAMGEGQEADQEGAGALPDGQRRVRNPVLDELRYGMENIEGFLAALKPYAEP